MSNRIAIIRTDRIGDLILTLPMASAIKRANPGDTVIFVVREYTAALARMSPEVDEVVVMDEAPSFLQLVKLFASLKADVVLFPNPTLQLAFAALVARIPIRIGTKFRGYSMFFNRQIAMHRKTAEMSEATYNVKMLEPLGIAAEETPLPNLVVSHPMRQRAGLRVVEAFGGLNLPFAVLHIPTAGSSKEWPEEHFIELARLLAMDVVPAILLTGTPRDSDRLGKILEKLKAMNVQAAVLTDASLPELAAILSLAAIVITNSTGPGHLAAALAAPTIGLFPLPTALSKQRWGFRGIRVINLSPPPIEGCPNCAVCTCMERLPVDSVRNIADALVNDAERRRAMRA